MSFVFPRPVNPHRCTEAVVCGFVFDAQTVRVGVASVRAARKQCPNRAPQRTRRLLCVRRFFFHSFPLVALRRVAELGSLAPVPRRQCCKRCGEHRCPQHSNSRMRLAVWLGCYCASICQRERDWFTHWSLSQSLSLSLFVCSASFCLSHKIANNSLHSNAG